MRLEDWQKFIESQFLDEEEPPVAPAPSSEPPTQAEAVVSEPVTPPPPVNARVNPFNTASPPLSNLKEPNRAANVPPIAPPVSTYRTPSGTGEPTPAPNLWGMDAEIPDFDDFIGKKPTPPPVETKKLPLEEELRLPLEEDIPPSNSRRVPKYRAKHAKNVRPDAVPQGLAILDFWERVPLHMQQLIALGRQNEEEVAQFSYKRPFAEQRKELIERILDPILSLEDTARLLNVCPTTVRRYTNRGILTCYRKEIETSSRAPENTKETRQRRFRLSDILAFLEAQQSVIQADREADASRLYPILTDTEKESL